jgi:oligoribonuclease
MLAWMDLEMTGLDPKRHTILEIATVITDDNLEIVAEGPDLVVSATESELAEMDEFVRNLHSRNGLLDLVAGSTLSLVEAGRLTHEFLLEHIPDLSSVPLCGNSIGTDRRFLEEHLPELASAFHYRNLDVSTLKELCRRWYPKAWSRLPRKGEHHRARSDVLDSIAELAYYREKILAGPEDDASGASS